jgi:hypothetical protein
LAYRIWDSRFLWHWILRLQSSGMWWRGMVVAVYQTTLCHITGNCNHIE